MANNNDCWARIDKEVASQDQTLNIFFTENETDYPRTVKIRVSSEDGSIEKFYTLVQKKRIKEFFENVEMSETFTKNDCDPEFEKGTEVVYTVPEATYISKVSQENADDQARQDIELNGQKYANEHGECITIKWLNRAATRTIRKNNCDPDTEEGSLETMTVPAAMFESYVSQADADDQAEKYLDQEAQGYANEHGHCTTIKWYNTEKSGKFTRNDCDVTQEGGEVTYVVEAGTYSSNISQEDADAKAQADVDANGQAYANATGECKTVLWYSEERSCTKTKNDCPEDYEGTEWTYEVPAGKYSSIISQADANSKADDDIEKNCQAAVNENASCVTIRWWNTKQQKDFTKNDCDSDTQKGSIVTMVVDAHTFSSDVSQEDADQKAIDYLNANGQNYANENGHCSEIKWYNTEQRGSATKDDCDVDERGTEVEYVVPAGKYTSTISQADADQKAKDDVEANRQEYANEHGECVRALWYSVRKECTKTRNDCAEGYIGEEWTYVVEAGKYSSSVSQADADKKAQDDIDTNCQAMVNGNAGCIPDPNYFLGTATFEFTKNDCAEHYTGSKVTISSEDPEITGRPFVSRTSQSDANAKALAAVKAQGQALANERGYCEEDQKWEGKYSQEFTKNNCADDGVGGKVIVTQEDVTGYPFISYVSQEEATNAAKAAVQAQGQAIANTKGNCTWFGTYSKEFTKDDCPAGREPSSMTVTQDDVTGRPFISNVSQADANSKAEAAVEAQGQQVANDFGNCEAVTVYIGHFSKEFTPECEECHTGVPMEVTEVNCGGPFSSYESQEAADALAQAAVLAQGQSYANKNGTCNEDDRSAWWEDVSPLETRCNNCVSQKKQVDTNPCSPTYNTNRWVDGGGRTCEWEGHYSQAFQKNDCDIEGAGTMVTVKETQISTYPFISCVSQEDADAKAKEGVQREGQAVANKNGMCRYKGVYSKKFTKSNCGTCTHGVEMTVTQDMVTGGPFWSEVSQDDANNKAKEAVEAQGQAYVNTHGSCEDDDKTPNWVAKQEFECQDGQSMQKYVDENPCSETADEIDWRPGGSLTCEWTGHASKQFTDYCLDGGVESGPITITEADVTGGPFTSTVSQEDANQKAMAAVEEQGPALARERGTCTWTAVAQGQYTKNDCGTCEQGEVMTVTSTLVNGTAVTSTISKEDAENKAKQVLADGAQAYVNKNGDCTDLKVSPVWTNTGSTQCVTSGSSCKGQRQKKNTAECAYENGSPVALNTTRWFDDSSVDCGYGSWQTDTSYGSDGCSGCTYHRVRYNECGQADYDSESNASTCGTTSTDWDCDGYTKHTWYYNTCSGSTWGDDYEYNSEDCGYNPCDSCSESDATQTRCSNGVSQYYLPSNCCDSGWKTGGKYCSCSDLNDSGTSGDCTFEKTCSGGNVSNTNQCSCSTTYYRSGTFTVNADHCDKAYGGCAYGWGVSGRQISASGSGSTCDAAREAMNADFYSKLQRSDCTCNNPEPEPTYYVFGEASVDQDRLGCSGATNIGSIPFKVRYWNMCNASRHMIVHASCSGRSFEQEISLLPGHSESSPGTYTGNIIVSGVGTCACNTVSVTGYLQVTTC